MQVLAAYTNPESHNAQRHRQTDRQTDRRTDNRLLPIADHTVVRSAKNPLRPCRSHLPLCRNCRSVANRIESYFCRSAVGRRPVSVLVTRTLTAVCLRQNGKNLVTSNAVNGKTFPAIPFSRATATAATERKNGNGKTERWKLCISPQRQDHGYWVYNVPMSTSQCEGNKQAHCATRYNIASRSVLVYSPHIGWYSLVLLLPTEAS